MTQKKIQFILFFFLFFILTQKGSYQIASIFDMYIIIKWRVYVNQDGPSPQDLPK